jgi:hypothetical protein
MYLMTTGSVTWWVLWESGPQFPIKTISDQKLSPKNLFIKYVNILYFHRQSKTHIPLLLQDFFLLLQMKQSTTALYQ